MNKLKVRHGQWVTAAALRVCEQKGGWERATFSIGEVAKQCDLSRPAIKRYLDECVEFGSMSRESAGGYMHIYQWTGK